jgi:hypothetical protein
MIRTAIAATVIALTLSGCAQILDNAAAEYRPASQFPQTPDVKQAVIACGHEVHRPVYRPGDGGQFARPAQLCGNGAVAL